MQTPRLSRHHEAASTLVLVAFIVALLGVLIGLALDYTANTATATRRGQDLTSAQALANGALETTYKRWQIYMASKQASTLSVYTKSADFTNFTDTLKTQLNTAAASTGFTVSDLTIQPLDKADNVDSPQKTANATIGPLTDVPGWIASTYNYRARVMVKKASDPNFRVSVSRYFQQSDASLFQAMLFFQDDLELHPGPQMTLYGLVHTNSNMYAAAGSGGSLTFTSNVSFHGSQATFNPALANPNAVPLPTPGYAPNYKYLDPKGYVEGVTARLATQESTNWTNFNAPVYPTGRSSQLANVQALNPLGSDEASAVDAANPNASGTHEIIERPAPVSGSLTDGSFNPNPASAYKDPDAFSAHRLYNSAGLRVFINHKAAYKTNVGTAAAPVYYSSNVHVYAPNPSDLTGGSSIEIVPGSTPTTKNIANSVLSAVTPDSSTGNITDMREGTAVKANTIDMSVLTPALNGYSDYNGVVYVSDVANANSNGDTGNTDAIRVKKGGVLPDAGLTLVSDGAVYVQGDFNTGTTYGADLTGNAVALATQPVSNTGADPTKFTVTGYTQKPAAIMGDAVMILSNAWNDQNSSLAVGSSRVATPTTINAAIVSGAVLTTKDAASGGAHNFPRFLEDWTGRNFTYHGSMVELYASQHFKGTYGKGNVYSPPNRRWFFDDNFLTTPPPGNLRSTSYARGRWIRDTNL